jgi:hypothetical protein
MPYSFLTGFWLLLVCRVMLLDGLTGLLVCLTRLLDGLVLELLDEVTIPYFLTGFWLLLGVVLLTYVV